MLSTPTSNHTVSYLCRVASILLLSYLLLLVLLIASLPFLKIAATFDLPITLARCSPTVRIWIFLANGLDIFLTFATVLRASAGVANLIPTVSLGFSSV